MNPYPSVATPALARRRWRRALLPLLMLLLWALAAPSLSHWEWHLASGTPA